MKKIFAIAALAVVAAFSANAEDEKFYIGGNVGFEHKTDEFFGTQCRLNSFTILPEFGYNFNDKWAVGGTLGYQMKHPCHSNTTSNIFQINPYARFTYFHTDNNLVQLFVDGGAGIGLGWIDYDGYDSDTAVTWNVGFRPGVAFNFSDKFSLVAHLGFLGYEGANNEAYKAGYDRRGGFFVNGNDVTLGFYFHF